MLEIALGACHGDPVVDLTALLADLRAEGDELDVLVSPLPAADWALPTPAEGWTVAHQVAHLAWTDDCALLSVTDPDGFRAKVAETLANHPSPLRWVDEGAEEGLRTPPAELLARWRTGRAAVLDSFAAAPDGVRHPWFATPMSTASMATARLMETWAHGTDVFDALGASRKPTARLKHVAYLGVRTRDFEVAALAREVAPFGGTYDSHVRDPGHDLIGSDTEVVEVARRAGIRGRIAHEKVVGLENAGLIEEVITLVTNARASGVDITSDQYPYDGAATGTLENLVVLPEELHQQPGFDLRVALKDPRVRAQLKETSEQGIDGGFAWLKATGYSQMRIVSAPSAPALVGRYLSQLAEEQRKPGFDLVADLLIAHTEPIRVTFGAILETIAAASVVPNLENGWSARVTGGVSWQSPTGLNASIGGEYGGLGDTIQYWRGKASVGVKF